METMETNLWYKLDNVSWVNMDLESFYKIARSQQWNIHKEQWRIYGGGGFRGFKPPPPLGCQVKI